MDCGQETCSGLRQEKHTSPKPRRMQSRKKHRGKCSQIHVQCLQRIPEEGTNSGHGGWSVTCLQQSAIQTAVGTSCTIWRQLDAYKMTPSSTPGKKGCHATWKLDLRTPTTDSGTSTRPAGKASVEVQMLVKANSKPHDIVIYTDSSVTRDWSGWGFMVKQGGRTVHKDCGAHSRDYQPDHGGRSSHICNTLASLPVWCTDYTCHHSHRLNEPPAKGGVWNGLPQQAYSHAHF